MENTIKGKEVIAYKVIDLNIACGYFQYEIGKPYKKDKPEFRKCGFHACLNPRDVLDYYLEEESSGYFKVLLSGEITKCGYFDTSVVATEMTIIELINIDEVIKTTEWWKNENVLDLLYFSDEFARVQRSDGLWNYINKQGKIISDEWFNYLDDFHEGFARVRRAYEEYNYIDKQGKLLSNEWFKWADDFKEGFAVVQRTNGEYCKIDKQGKIVSISK